MLLVDTKGITKVMVSILLLVLILAASLFIYFFFFGPPVEEAECAIGINWKVLLVGGKEDFCYNLQKQEIRFTIENGAVVPLQGIYVKANDKDLFLEHNLEKAGVFIGKMPFDLIQDRPLTKIQLFPVVDIEGEATACIDDVIERMTLANCAG